MLRSTLTSANIGARRFIIIRYAHRGAGGGRTRSSPHQGLAGFRDRCLTVRPLLPGGYTLYHTDGVIASQYHVRSAEPLGFEPREPLTRFNGFQDRRNQPLCHSSAEHTPCLGYISLLYAVIKVLSSVLEKVFFLPVSLFNHSARCASPGSNRDPGLVTGTRTSTSRVCQFRHKRTEPDGMGRRNRRQIDESILIATISSKKKVGPLFFPLSVPTSCPSFRS